MKRPILNRSSNGAPPPIDNIRQLDVSRNAKRASNAASVAVAGGPAGAAADLRGLVDQPRAAISLPSKGSLAGSITALLPAVGIVPDGAGKRR
jgi:hypothetical protein